MVLLSATAQMDFYIQDVIVHPHFQGKGIGKAMMKDLMNYLDRYASKGSFIGLMAAKGKERFYKSFGFAERPNDIYGAGMCIYKGFD
jgi:ribosomal protein S18 acetylase RimI-like enzyme